VTIYGNDPVDTWRRAATFVDRILRGAKPAELPFQFPTKFELVVNLKTAKALGLTIPETLLATADVVIQWHIGFPSPAGFQRLWVVHSGTARSLVLRCTVGVSSGSFASN
jgi:ABC transporter substrate binding protein